MKIFIAVLCLSMSLGAWAATGARSGGSRNYGMAGCGLGSMVFRDKGIFGQTCAATTNGTAYNQFFAISSGTSNCTPTEDQIAQVEYINGNLATLQKEIAQGDGLTLAGLSQVLGCKEASFDTFAKELKNNHDAIFAKPGALPVLDATIEVMQNNAELKQSCQKLG